MPLQIMQQLLFGGEEVAKTPSTRMSHIQEFRAWNHYRDAENLRRSDKCCKTCKYAVRTGCNSRRYYKCEWTGFSRCMSTDIGLGKVCDKWEKEES